MLSFLQFTSFTRHKGREPSAILDLQPYPPKGDRREQVSAPQLVLPTK